MNGFIEVLKVVGETAFHQIVVINKTLDGFKAARLLSTVVKSPKRNKPKAIPIIDIFFLVFPYDVGHRVEGYILIKHQLTIIYLVIEPNLVFIVDLDAFYFLLVKTDSFDIPIYDVFTSTVGVFCTNLDNTK